MIKKELGKRIITSIVLIAVVLSCLYINNLSWILLLLVVSLICWFEFIDLARKIWKNKIIINLPIILSFLFLSLFLSTAYKIKIDASEEVVLFILLICIFSDIGGYVIGKSVGGKKLTKISPNKTISGSIGSFLFCLFPILIWIYNGEHNLNLNVFFFCLTISFACQLGDLVISYFKRLAKVKDAGNILPGHGGMLDRIDGVIFAIPTTLIIGSLL